MTRRSFLWKSVLCIIGLAIPQTLFGQEQRKPEDKKENKPEDKPEDKKEEEVDPYKVNHLDSHGVVYRICPECGGMMYKEGCTWLCEMCGYSYEEC